MLNHESVYNWLWKLNQDFKKNLLLFRTEPFSSQLSLCLSVSLSLSLSLSHVSSFPRLYPVSTGQEGEVQYLSISHSGVRLVRREKSLPTDYLKVSEVFLMFSIWKREKIIKKNTSEGSPKLSTMTTVWLKHQSCIKTWRLKTCLFLYKETQKKKKFSVRFPRPPDPGSPLE